MIEIQVSGGKENCLRLAKRMVFLAWKACGQPIGMGVFQDRSSNQSEDQIWQHAFDSRDYSHSDNKDGNVYCDYVQGRMMKFGVQWNDKAIIGRDSVWRGDYQSFCHKYPDFRSLVADAAIELGIEISVSASAA